MTQSTSESESVSYKAFKKPDVLARRTRLRQFQAQLTERVQAARTGTDQRSRQLGLLVGNTRCLLDLTQVSEVMSVGRMTKVPLTHDWYLGLTSVRGNLIGVIDFARYLGQPAVEAGPESRIVVFAPTLSFNCGLLVTRVLGLRNVDEMRVQPGDGSAQPAWQGQRYVDQEEATWTRVDLSLMVQDPQFLHVGI